MQHTTTFHDKNIRFCGVQSLKILSIILGSIVVNDHLGVTIDLLFYARSNNVLVKYENHTLNKPFAHPFLFCPLDTLLFR